MSTITWQHPNGSTGAETESDPDIARLIADSAAAEGCRVWIDGDLVYQGMISEEQEP